MDQRFSDFNIFFWEACILVHWFLELVEGSSRVPDIGMVVNSSLVLM